MLSPSLYEHAVFSLAVMTPHRLAVMDWLRQEALCPWDVGDLAEWAVLFGQLELLQYIHEHGGPFTADQLTEQLVLAGEHGHLRIAQWLRDKQGAPWPLMLQNWCAEMMAWARSAGYTGP